MPTSTPPVSRERRRHVARLIKRVGLHSAPLSNDARLTYVIGALVASDDGFVADSVLIEAAKDAKIVALAANLLAVTGLDAATL